MKLRELVPLGLPGFGLTELESRGITRLDPLQERAVRAGLFEGRNLVIMAPTSSGKTLIAELAALYPHLPRQLFPARQPAFLYEHHDGR
jgi:helicase